MRKLMRGFLLLGVACLLGAAPAAWACCPGPGRVVCVGTDTGVADVKVLFSTAGQDVQVVTSDASGNFETWFAWCGLSYDITLDLSGAGVTGAGALVSQSPVFCDALGTATPDFLKYEVEVPGCEPPPVTADCSPGYYKNHPEAWCTAQCGFVEECAVMTAALGAKGSGSAEIRDATKALIDACFVTAAASPCLDD
jgi:hypothetical protein